MENCAGMRLKMKRKEFDDANDEVFADFCLSSPACKIRRLNADVPSIVEQDASGVPLRNEVTEQLNPLDIEELPFVPENNEKAIVLFKPINKPLFYSPNNFSIDPNLISSFKNRALSYTRHSATKPNEEAADDHDNNGELNGCKAIIPWVPSSQPPNKIPFLTPRTEGLVAMETEDMEVSMMEIEEDSVPSVGQQGANQHIEHSPISEGLQQQWQQKQQHCMVQQPQNTTTPIVWYR